MIETIIFASKDDRGAGWRRSQNLHDELRETNVKVRLINKLGFDLEELQLVARYRVVSTPTVVVLRDGRQVYRKVGLPPPSALREVLDAQRRASV